MSISFAVQNALKEIHFYRGIRPLHAYEVLTQHREEAVPFLLQELKNAIERHDKTGDYYVAHIHALLLLSQFREQQAYPLVIKLLNLPIKSIDRLLGDLFTDTMQKIVASTYDGNPEPLFSLLLNQDKDQVLRLVIGSCISALIYQNLLDRKTAILDLQKIVASGKMNEDQAFYTALANITLDCRLEPLYETVKAAFRAGWVIPDCMSLQNFENDLSKNSQQLLLAKELGLIKSAAEEISLWYQDEKCITPNIDRNAPCPCGSGHKFKKCCINKKTEARS